MERVVVELRVEGGCPESPLWKSEDEGWSEDESVSSGVSRENNVCNGALHVNGLDGPGDKISLFLEGARDGAKLSHCPGNVVPGNA